MEENHWPVHRLFSPVKWSYYPFYFECCLRFHYLQDLEHHIKLEMFIGLFLLKE